MDLNHQRQDGTACISPGAIKTVAVIGAGLSGLVSAVHLLRAGIDVTVLEREDTAGGAWKYNPQPAHDPPFPSLRPPAPDLAKLEELQKGQLSLEEAQAEFTSPGPVYENMKSRGNKVVMRTSLLNWPEGSGDQLHHGEVLKYLRDIARIYLLEEKIRFRTRVEAVSKQEGCNQWRVQTSRFAASSNHYTIEKQTWKFDAVVVATGRYGIPRVPDVLGLAAWKHMFPSRVTHAKQYRSPAPFRAKRVVIIGAFISAAEITKELTENNATVFQSALDTKVDFRDQASPDKAEKVAMVDKFVIFGRPQNESCPEQPPLDGDSPIPGQVVLQDGQVLDGIHHVILATGYLTTYPFLGPALEQPFTSPQDADEKVVITADARTVHNLHEDIFYIPDPTLAFIGVTQFATTFSLYDFQAQVLAAVFAGRVRLPSEGSMKAEQKRRKSRVIPGTLLNSIFLLDDMVVQRMLDWVNKDLLAGGFEPLPGPDAAWWSASKKLRENSRELLGVFQDNYLA